MTDYVSERIARELAVANLNELLADNLLGADLRQQYSHLWPKSPVPIASDLAQCDLPAHFVERLRLLEECVSQPLRSKHPTVSFRFNLHRLTGLGYYHGPCFHIKMKNHADESFTLADGGFVDWTQVLLGDTKERLMTSAIGTELICRLFQKPSQPGGAEGE